MSGNGKDLFTRFDRHPRRYVAFLVIAYLFINNGINATSEWMEATRNGKTPSFEIWEPFVWEYSSAVSALLCIWILFMFFARFPLRFSGIPKQFVVHFVASVLFSLCHVGIMVLLRKLVYQSGGGEYHFGHWPTELFYEYRKDAWGYAFWLMMFHIYQFVYSRLKGEASLLNELPDDENAATKDMSPEHLLVKKLDKEFLVKVDDIEWLEASGNYVNLHSKGRIYPLRSTLTGLLPRIEKKGFSRVHRSYVVNLEMIDCISSSPSGDGSIKLKNGQSLALSRRYKDAFKQKLA